MCTLTELKTEVVSNTMVQIPARHSLKSVIEKFWQTPFNYLYPLFLVFCFLKRFRNNTNKKSQLLISTLTRALKYYFMFPKKNCFLKQLTLVQKTKDNIMRCSLLFLLKNWAKWIQHWDIQSKNKKPNTQVLRLKT